MRREVQRLERIYVEGVPFWVHYVFRHILISYLKLSELYASLLLRVYLFYQKSSMVLIYLNKRVSLHLQYNKTEIPIHSHETLVIHAITHLGLSLVNGACCSLHVNSCSGVST